ncbi:CopG family antitoxin [Spirochaeta lutea]|uniref:Antitoxin n=1 Tax=Spirochaeta lutea TaxID=1480694 RepID=A0A098QWR2_9SPIO|nr:antitoxin [Spirochaeta lutea]KGE72169.1 antitoxin [Spirochaeta lutea]
MNEKKEKELMNSLEAGEWQPATNFKNIKQELENAAKKTAVKDHRINIRISKRDVEALKAKAMEEGIPYQTLVTSILHKYVTGNLKEVGG